MGGNHTIISTDTKKAFTKANTLSWLKKTHRKLGIEGRFLNMIKGIYEKPTANIMPHDERLKALLVISQMGQQRLLSPCYLTLY